MEYGNALSREAFIFKQFASDSSVLGKRKQKKIESAQTDCLLSLASGIPLHTNNYSVSWYFSWKHLQDPKSFLASFFFFLLHFFPLLFVIALIEKKWAWKRDSYGHRWSGIIRYRTKYRNKVIIG